MKNKDVNDYVTKKKKKNLKQILLSAEMTILTYSLYDYNLVS